ncbi:MAG: class I SAM-dependent methyltransferase [Pseudomonadota bacterium]
MANRIDMDGPGTGPGDGASRDDMMAGRAGLADQINMAQQIAGNTLRLGWYSGVNWLMTRESLRHGKPPEFTPTKPVPTRDALISDVRGLMQRDAKAVRDGLYPPAEDGIPLSEHLTRLRAMFADIPDTVRRRSERDTVSVRDEADIDPDLPDYFQQDFHFQTGGYLSEGSAKLYDIQVETLFYGSAAPMRRAALRPIHEHVRGRDQRSVSLLDVACGTGRLLRDVRRAFPAMKLAGIDLSQSYLDEAERHLGNLRRVSFAKANAEELPVLDASQDIVTSVFLFHELPPEVRRTVAREVARVLRPGGIFVFIDSLQMGDRPDWDGLLEAFPARFHEPYFRHYAIDDLDGVFNDVGLVAEETEHVFLSKMMVRRKAG